MKYSKKVCVQDKVIVALNAQQEKYLNYQTSTIGNTIGNVCLRFRESDKLYSFGLPKKFNTTNG